MKYLKGYRIKACVSIAAKVIEAIFELFLPLLMVQLINEGFNSSAYPYTLFKMILLVLGGYVFTLLCQVWASQTSQAVGGRVRDELFSHIMTFSMPDFDIFSPGTLVNRISVDTNQFQLMIAMFIRQISRAPIQVIGSIIALYSLDHRLALILLMVFPVLAIVIWWFMIASLKQNKKAQSKLDILVNKAKESISGVRVIRAFSKSESFAEKFEAQNDELYNTQKKAAFINTLSSPTISVLMNGTLLLLVYVGAFEVQAGTMVNTELLAVISYCTQLVLSLIIVTNLVMIISRGMTSLGRINEVMDHETLVPNVGSDTVSEGPIGIEFKNVSFSYPNQKRRVLKDINIKIEAGETIGIIGLTASGKSTLVQLLPRLYDVSSGSLLLNNKDIKTYDLKSVRRNVAYIAQSAEFVRDTLESNIDMINSGKEVSQFLLQASGEDILTKGLDNEIYEKGSNLSGGQKQRVNIARALAKEAGLIIFDDSFSALDNLTDAKIRTMLKEEYQNKTQIIVSQKTSAFKDVDRVYVLVNGCIEAQGTHEYLLETMDLYAKINELQQEDM